MWMAARSCILVVVPLCLVPSDAATPVRVETTSGWVVGQGKEDGSAVFKGIPYAEPPVGDLRFRKARPMKWQGDFNANEFGNACMQPPSKNFPPDAPISEDCLYLNMWTPPNAPVSTSASKGAPIMFFIHGGGFNTGSGSEGLMNGARLAQTGVLLVTMNYRMGAFGLLASEEIQKESNTTGGLNAIRDQILALEWVRANAATFGGNAEDIMLFGESAGSISACTMWAIEQVRPMFARVGLESGPCNGFAWGPRTMVEGVMNSKLLMAELGVTSLADLRKLDATKIVDATNHHPQGPSLDGDLLTEMPGEIFARIGGGNKQLLIGGTSVDGLYEPPWVNELPFPDVAMWRNWIQKWLKGVSVAAIERLYPASTPRGLMQATSKLRGDLCVHCPLKWLAEQVAPTSEVYAFEFAFMPNATYPSMAPHVGELFHVFGNEIGVVAPYGFSPQLADLMVTEWSNFAKGRFVPNRPSWPAFQHGDEAYYVFDWPSNAVPDAQPGLRLGWETERCNMWKSLDISQKEEQMKLVQFCLSPQLVTAADYVGYEKPAQAATLGTAALSSSPNMNMALRFGVILGFIALAYRIKVASTRSSLASSVGREPLI